MLSVFADWGSVGGRGEKKLVAKSPGPADPVFIILSQDRRQVLPRE